MIFLSDGVTYTVEPRTTPLDDKLPLEPPLELPLELLLVFGGVYGSVYQPTFFICVYL